MTVLIALVAALTLSGLFALGPLWLLRQDAGAGEFGAGPRSLSLSLGGSRLRRSLVAFQVAAAVTLLVGGGLLWRSFDALMRADTGFSGRGFVVASVTPEDARIAGTEASAGQRLAAWYAEVSRLPGVHAASFASAPPFSQSEIVSSFELVGRSARRAPAIAWSAPVTSR